MLTRIINNNNEDIFYPLNTPNTVYPNSIVSDISILITDDSVSDVYLDSITVDNDYIHVLFTGSTSSGHAPLGYAAGYVNDHKILSIIGSDTEKKIGWISFGTLPSRNASYAERVKICQGCILRPLIDHNYYRMYVNHKEIQLPSSLNIDILGDLDTSSSHIDTYTDNVRLTLRDDVDTRLYDHDAIEDNGGIVYINKVENTKGELVIDLPVVQSETNVIAPPFCATTETLTTDGCIDPDTGEPIQHKYTIVTIQNHVSQDSELLAPFTCPPSDILKDKIFVEKDLLYETPLDDFLKHYTEGEGSRL